MEQQYYQTAQLSKACKQLKFNLKNKRNRFGPGLPGLIQINLFNNLHSGDRSPLLFIPPCRNNQLPKKLLVYFHGAGDIGHNGIRILPEDVYSTADIYILIMSSYESTWDGIQSSYGPDLRSTDLAISMILQEFPQINDIAISGFSDGGSYALSVGLANPCVFSHILAFSPGFIIGSSFPNNNRAQKIYISHGTADRVLSIDRCSRRIVEKLQQKDHLSVIYEEFSGKHEIPRQNAVNALSTWFST